MTAEELTAYTLAIYIAVVIVAGALSLLYNSFKWTIRKLLRRKR